MASRETIDIEARLKAIIDAELNLDDSKLVNAAKQLEALEKTRNIKLNIVNGQKVLDNFGSVKNTINEIGKLKQKNPLSAKILGLDKDSVSKNLKNAYATFTKEAKKANLSPVQFMQTDKGQRLAKNVADNYNMAKVKGAEIPASYTSLIKSAEKNIPNLYKGIEESTYRIINDLHNQICNMITVSAAEYEGISPSKVAGNMLEAVKSQDVDILKSYYDGDVDTVTGDFTFLSYQKTSEDLTNDQKAILKKITDRMLDFDYSIGKEMINGDSAIVSVKFMTYKFGSMFNLAFSEYMQTAFSYVFSDIDLSDEKKTELLYDKLEKQMEQLKEKDYIKTVDINLEKTNDGWKVKKLDSEKLDAITGSVYSALGIRNKAFDS